MGVTVHSLRQRNEKRPIQNYAHAVLGLLIIALSLYLVNQGGEEWVQTMGLPFPFPPWSNYLYLFQVIVRHPLFHGLLFCSNAVLQSFPILYFGALVLLRRQFQQEKASREQATAADKLLAAY